MKFLRIALMLLLVISISVFGYSLYQVLLNSSVLSHSLILIGSLLSAITFFALIISKDKGTSAIIWFCLALLNIILFFVDYIHPDFLKQSYGVSLALIFSLLFYSIQKIQEHYHKRFYKQLKVVNYGTILIVATMIILKIENNLSWNLLSYVIIGVLLLNFVLYLLPKETTHSKNEPKP